MRKKLLIITLIAVLLIAIPLAIATVTNQQTISVSGTAHYPNVATPDPTATPTQSPTATVSYSLTLPNGTAYPTSLNNFPLTVEVSNGPVSPSAAGEIFNVTNTGNVAINMTIAAANVNLPSNLAFNLGWGNYNGGSTTVGVGQSITMWFIPTAYPVTMYNPDGSLTFTPGAAFSYSFNIVITGTQA